LYPQVFGKYVLERELSRGGMARVLLATLRGAGGFEKRLVVKQIRDELAFDQVFIRRFVEEAKTTVALSHPNIVPVYELGVEQGTYFLAMELVEGVSVAELIRERNEDGSRRVLSAEEGAHIGVEVCRALDYAHRRMRVVHRDITPRNVMIDEEGQIKLIDFGIAAPALVSGQEILGSPGHMAPEQLARGELGPPTDIFAVAVLLMEAWTGTAPFRRATPEECAAAVREPHPRPSDFEPRLVPLDTAIARAMNVDPKKRQQEASDLARELRAFLQGVDVADVARALGDRVKQLREVGSESAPPSRVSHPRPSVASHSDLGTKTFAARDEALRWSRPPEEELVPSVSTLSEDEQIGVPSTRVLDSVGRVPSVPSRPAPVVRRRDDPSMGMPTPLMVDVDDLERIHAEHAAKIENGADATPNSEKTPAAPPAIVVRPAEVPTVRRRKRDRPGSMAPAPLGTSSTRRRARGSRGRAIAGAAAALLVAGGAIAAWRSHDSASPLLGPKATATFTMGTTPTVSWTSLTGSVPPPAPPTSAKTSATVATAAPNGSVPTAAPSGSAAIATRAAVSLVGDPGTRVWVDGVARGSCPARVNLDPGSHEVRFTFDPTGESRVERLSVKSGDHVIVRAEFTGASPTVKVQR
jgi:serine/threonine-protein kinase